MHFTDRPTNSPTEQPLLLQRRLPHVPPPEPAAPLARAPRRLPAPEGDVRHGEGPGLPQHRLPHDHGPAAHEGLPDPGEVPGADRGPDGLDAGGEGRDAAPAHEEVQRGGDPGEVSSREVKVKIDMVSRGLFPSRCGIVGLGCNSV